MTEADVIRELKRILFGLPAEERAALFAILVEGYAIEDVCFGVGEALGETRRLFKAGAEQVRQALEAAGLPRLTLIALGELLRRVPVPEPSPALMRRLSRLLKEASLRTPGRW